MDFNHNKESVTVQVLTKQVVAQSRHPNDVDFDVKYPEGYSGQRIMPEGVVTVSKEAAEKFTAMGIGKVAETTTNDQSESKITEDIPDVESVGALNEESTSESKKGKGKKKQE